MFVLASAGACATFVHDAFMNPVEGKLAISFGDSSKLVLFEEICNDNVVDIKVPHSCENVATVDINL